MLSTVLTRFSSFSSPAPGRHPHHCAGRALHQGLHPCLPGHLAEAGRCGGPCSGLQVPLNPPEADVSVTVNKKNPHFLDSLVCSCVSAAACGVGGREQGAREGKHGLWAAGSITVWRESGWPKGRLLFVAIWALSQRHQPAHCCPSPGPPHTKRCWGAPGVWSSSGTPGDTGL